MFEYEMSPEAHILNSLFLAEDTVRKLWNL